MSHPKMQLVMFTTQRTIVRCPLCGKEYAYLTDERGPMTMLEWMDWAIEETGRVHFEEDGCSAQTC